DKVPATLATGGMAVSERFVCTAHAGASPYLPTSPYYSISCFARDPQNGTLRRGEGFALSTRAAEGEFGSPDVLYVTLYLRNAIGMLRLNPATGKLSWLQPAAPTVPAGENPVPIKCNPVYPLCYAGNTGHQATVETYSINPDKTLTAR